MAGIHNGFLRAINSAYLQAPYIKEPADKLDLAEYIETWVYVMHKHHTAEENIGFPGLVKLSDGEWEAQSAENLRQHAELDSKMDDLSAWCKQDTTQPRWTSILRSKIEIAMASVHPHLQDELPTLEELVKYDKAAIRAVIDEVERDVQAKSDAVRSTSFSTWTSTDKGQNSSEIYPCFWAATTTLSPLARHVSRLSLSPLLCGMSIITYWRDGVEVSGGLILVILGVNLEICTFYHR